MTKPIEITEARRKLGLTHSELAHLLGYQGTNTRQMGYDISIGKRPLREPQRRLLEAYLSGYRPDDWPNE